MSDDDLLSLEEHRRRRDKNPSLVRCARCGQMIVATATRCPECGVHFQGEAQEFTHPSEQERGPGRARTWVVVVVLLLALALLLYALGPW